MPLIHVNRCDDVLPPGDLVGADALSLIQIKARHRRRWQESPDISETDMRMHWALAAGFLVAAAVFAGRAFAHWREMTMFGPICGDATIHCAWCYAAEASLLAAAISFAFAIADQTAVSRAKPAVGEAGAA